ncbi:uncharacterized protein N7459_006216 [Penicillium hispanicum]|uniref:uncharacterized protein n=1 Tax=Penicillium hispanicum TaxID=1080232 RepID=UPI002541694B|nr:uncharacterized protein N7459_006216 [Penicillium hispanicum]KAJ5580231.1 hypothetical protein N7459_006216 [Penicillium hispanicum]
MSDQYHQLAPGPSPTSDKSSPTKDEAKTPGSLWKKRVSTACLACKKSKRKCSGTAPCDNCRSFRRVCIFDESLDQRRRVAAKRTADELSYHRDLLGDLFKLVREADESKALQLLDIIRHNAPAHEIRSYIDETLSELGAAGETSHEAVSKLEDMRNLINVEGASPVFRRKVMDIHYLCDEAPFQVPARPWTTVTEDSDLVSHLVSLYFTWDYPFHAFVDQGVFLRHMANGELGSEFCSPYLVNAMLSNACYFSEFSEAYVVPGDISSKGSDFLAEAERLKEVQSSRPSLAKLQGTLLMHERYVNAGQFHLCHCLIPGSRYAMSRNDDLGYIMLHEAIRMGESLGLVGTKGPRIASEHLSQEMDTSCRRTAWGLFNIDTYVPVSMNDPSRRIPRHGPWHLKNQRDELVLTHHRRMVHTGFLRPCLIDHVNIPRIALSQSDDESVWGPYPTHRETRPAYLSLYFDEACNLSTIARDVSRSMFGDDRGVFEPVHRQSREVLYERLRHWCELWPNVFELRYRPPPSIILLK